MNGVDKISYDIVSGYADKRREMKIYFSIHPGWKGRRSRGLPLYITKRAVS